MDSVEDNSSELSDENLVLIRISIPDLTIQKCMQFHQEELIWDIKQQILAMLSKDLKESFNYGLYCPPLNGRAGKFLDDERPLMDYPFPGPIGNLELKYKRRVYKMIHLDAKQIRQLHTKANFRRILDYVSNCQAEKISKLCSKGMDPNFHCPENGETPLTLAICHKSCKKIILALANGGAHLDFRTRDGVTALHRAVEKNNIEAIKTLLDLGASPNYKDCKGLTPLYYSVVHPTDAHICELLLHDHAVIGASDDKQWQETHQACRNGLVQHLEHLLFYGADLNARNAPGNTPLHVCAANEQEGCARVLLFRGADKEALNYANQTPDQVAVIAGNLDLAEVIKRHQLDSVVHFREAPTYNPRRRSSAVLNRARSDPRLEITLGLKPPSPSPSNRSLPPFSCASSLSETSTGSSTCTQHSNDDSSGETASISAVTERSIASDSSGICVHSVPEPILLTPGLSCVCVENYLPVEDGHLHLAQGDIVEITGSTDDGYLEGISHGLQGIFPSSCVQEVWLRKRVEGRREFKSQPSVPSQIPVSELKKYLGESRTVALHKGKKGFGFVLRGAKSTSPLMEIQPSERFPALQYLDDVDPGGPADLAGLSRGDFLIAINGEDVSHVSHEYVVNLIRKSGSSVTMTVISCPQPSLISHQHLLSIDHQQVQSTRQFSTLPRKLSCGKSVPIPPRRDPSTTLSVGRYKARSMVAGLAEFEYLDRSVSQPKSSNRTTVAEIEQMFNHKQNEVKMNIKDGGKLPKVYASVAEMKRSKIKTSKLEKLHKVFHSTPDLKQQNFNKLHDDLPHETIHRRSQDDVTVIRLNGMNLQRNQITNNWKSTDDIYRFSSLAPPAPTHPPPPPPVSQVVRVDVSNGKSDYAKVINVVGTESVPKSSQPVMSSFRPGDSAKLYASPVELNIIGYSSTTNSNCNSVPTYKPVSIVHSTNNSYINSNNSSEAETSGDSATYHQNFKFKSSSNLLNANTVAVDTISTDSGNSSEVSSNLGHCSSSHYAQSSDIVNGVRNANKGTPFIPEPDYDVSDDDVNGNHDDEEFPPPPPPLTPELEIAEVLHLMPELEKPKPEPERPKSDLMSDLKSLIAKKAAEKQRKSVALLNDNQTWPLDSVSAAEILPSQLKPAAEASNLQNVHVVEVSVPDSDVNKCLEEIEQSMKLIEMHANSLQEVNELVGLSPSTKLSNEIEMIAPPPEFSDLSMSANSSSKLRISEVTSNDVSDKLSASKLPVRAKLPAPTFNRMTAIRGSKSSTLNRAVTSSSTGAKSRIVSTGTLKSIETCQSFGNRVKINVATISHVDNNNGGCVGGGAVLREFQTKSVSDWSVGDVGEWLDSLYLTEYKGRFEASRIDGQRLLLLGSSGLTDLGVKRIGHRMNIERSLKKHSMMKNN
ncbi:hypothetical protein CHUAL_005416 [Chamberlinius hualienensis]